MTYSGYEMQLAEKDARIESLRQQLETERVRLAACGVVALANTPESAAKARKMLPEYRSGSCDDVAAAVDREMALRQQLASRDAEVASLKADNEYLYVPALERDILKERLDLLIESSEMLAAELDELRLDSKRYDYLTRECRTRDFIIPASERKQSIDSAIDKALAATEPKQ